MVNLKMEGKDKKYFKTEIFLTHILTLTRCAIEILFY